MRFLTTIGTNRFSEAAILLFTLTSQQPNLIADENLLGLADEIRREAKAAVAHPHLQLTNPPAGMGLI